MHRFDCVLDVVSLLPLSPDQMDCAIRSLACLLPERDSTGRERSLTPSCVRLRSLPVLSLLRKCCSVSGAVARIEHVNV